METGWSGAEALTEALLAQGTRTIYGLPGAQLDPFFSALYDVADRIRVVTSRHEQGAAYMALGHALATGETSVYTVVPGPGWLNASAALATAYGCNAPVVCLTGQIPSSSIGRGIGELHELPDQLAMARGVTKWAARIEHPSDAPRLLARAFEAAQRGRPRPVHLEMAPDVMMRRTRKGLVSGPVAGEPLAAEPEAIKAAVQALSVAERPLIFVGSGAIDAFLSIRELAIRLQAPVTALRRGRGIVDERSWLFQPWHAAHGLWRDADVVLAIGTRLDFPRRMWGADGVKIVRIDVDPSEIDRLGPPTVAINADARVAVDDILAALPSGRRVSREAELRARKQAAEDELSGSIAPQMAILRAIREALPEDGILVDELTQVGYASWCWFPSFAPRRYLSSGYQGTLGYGFPTALGAKAAKPEQAVLSIAGDGGFMFAVQELATAVQHGINLVTIVFRDNKFGNVQRIQKERYGGRVIGSDLHNPDFVDLARSFGVAAMRCESPAALTANLRGAFAADRPTLIEYPMVDVPSPWGHIVLPRVR